MERYTLQHLLIMYWGLSAMGLFTWSCQIFGHQSYMGLSPEYIMQKQRWVEPEPMNILFCKKGIYILKFCWSPRPEQDHGLNLGL